MTQTTRLSRLNSQARLICAMLRSCVRNSRPQSRGSTKASISISCARLRCGSAWHTTFRTVIRATSMCRIATRCTHLGLIRVTERAGHTRLYIGCCYLASRPQVLQSSQTTCQTSGTPASSTAAPTTSFIPPPSVDTSLHNTDSPHPNTTSRRFHHERHSHAHRRHHGSLPSTRRSDLPAERQRNPQGVVPI